jgi:phosphopantetheine adenylyltransferase
LALSSQENPLQPEELCSCFNAAGDELASNVVLDSWEGLISEYPRKTARRAFAERGSMADVPYEQMMAAMNSRLGNPLETMIMFSSPELSDISSSAVGAGRFWKRLPMA